MAENEIELAGEVGLPFTAKLSVRYKRRWSDRASRFVDDVARESGLAVEGLEDRIEQDERLEDVLLEGAAKAGRVSDPDYREALALVVAAAFSDDAKVDEVEQLAGQLMTLDAFSLRVLRESYRRHDGKPRFARYPIDPYRIRKALSVEPRLVEAALARLAGLGLVTNTLTFGDIGDSTVEALQDRSERWMTTQWGLRAVELCRRQITAGPPPDA